MIFGFNTDVKHGEIVYHVQSEAQPTSRTLLSTIFVQGRCLGKKSTSYESHGSDGDLTEQQIHERLKTQHRQILEAIRQGKVEQVLAASV